MKSLILIGILILQILYPLQAQIIETYHFTEILPYITKDCLVILDIDDTLLVPKQMLGCDEWFCYRYKTYQQKGLSASEALEKSLAEWESLRHIIEMQLVEPNTDQIIASLQKQGYALMGLTTQGLALATRTSLQLQQLGIDLSLTAPFPTDHYVNFHGHSTLFRKGILFTSGTHKGKVLFQFLQDLSYHPFKILFLNDKLSHLKEVEEIVEAQGIEFFGFRYGYSDAKKQAFDPEIAELQYQLSSFTHILSDEEVYEHRKKNAAAISK